MISMSTILTAVVGFVVSAAMGILLIPLLRRLKFGQTILEEGPKWHQAKQGTPTMGGFIFIIGSVFALIAGCAIAYYVNPQVFSEDYTLTKIIAGVCMALCFAAIGFIDDYIKVVKKQNLGLRAKQKFLLQILVTAGYLTALYFLCGKSTAMNIPFLGEVDLGFLYYILVGILIVGIVNSTNLTDGIDGLCGSVTFVVGIFFMIVTAVLNLTGMNLLATALASSCLGFLLFNLHPAKVFMGDTGSLFLGGMVIALAFGVNMPFILFFVGFIYCFESLSVMLQIISVKTRGKRIFKMSPVHHHFEMCGMSENKIVVMFCAITAIMCVIAYFGMTIIIG